MSTTTLTPPSTENDFIKITLHMFFITDVDRERFSLYRKYRLTRLFSIRTYLFQNLSKVSQKVVLRDGEEVVCVVKLSIQN